MTHALNPFFTPVAAPASPVPQEPTAEIVEISPMLATQWLDRQIRNRNEKPKKIDEYARDMAAGNWLLTGEAIKFAHDGSLLDGQNRLQAVIKSGASIRSWVVWGIDPTAQDVMDTGAGRTAGDTLTMMSVKNATLVASAARLALSVERDVPMVSGRFTHSEIRGWVDSNPDISAALEITGTSRWRMCPLRPSVATFCAWRLARIDRPLAKVFFDGLIESINLDDVSPIRALRRRLAGGYGADRRISPDEQTALTFRVWNAFRTGETLTRVLVASRSGRIAIPEPV